MAPRRAYRVVAIVVASVVVAGGLMGHTVAPSGNASSGPKRVPLSEVLSDVRSHRVSKARMDEDASTVLVDLTSPSSPQAPAQSKPQSSHGGSRQELAVYTPSFGGELAKILDQEGVGFSAEVARGAYSSLGSLAMTFIPLALVIGFLVLFARRQRQGVGAAGFSNGRGTTTDIPVTRFQDVAGVDEAVEELAEVSEFLHDPTPFERAGAKVPHGFLLVGPPGTGKTLLARAVAGEAGVPFFALSGSDFVETFVGVGAARVRQVFDKAKKHGRAIIFIDEIDAVGRARANGPSTSGNDERESTLNQLLVEMDGFHQTGVIVLGATNRADLLDAALLRPGRFDRQIAVPAPDRAGRTKILELHGKKNRLAEDVDFVSLARRTPGLTGADLAFLVNEAALQAAREGRDTVNGTDLEHALGVAMLGRERRSAVQTQRDREVTAWHEAGHAVAALMQEKAEDPVQVTIVPRGQAGGVTWMGGSDENFMTRSEARAKLVVAMAGRAAEELLLDGDFTQGASGDLSSATQLATDMVTRYGMSPLGVASIDPDRLLGPGADRVHEAVAGLLEDALADARALVRQRRRLLEAVVGGLLEDETLHLADLIELAQATEDVGSQLGERFSSVATI